MLTVERLREVVLYDAQSGQFRFIGHPERKCGTIWRRTSRRAAYLKIGIDRLQYSAHRLAWLYVHGVWPLTEIDHINGDGLDNRLANLREATPAQNRTNALAQKSNRLGLRGVHFHPAAKRYRAQICKNGKTRHIGYFDTPELAHAAYLKAAQELHGEFVRTIS